MRLAALALCLAGCSAPEWHIVGGEARQREEAQAILDHARGVIPLPDSGFVEIVPVMIPLGGCGDPADVPPGARGYAGCCWVNGVTVWALPGQAMETTALRHEICHYAGHAAEWQADECAKQLQGTP